MYRNALQIFKAEDPDGFSLFEIAAKLSRSDKVPVEQRMGLIISIADTVAPYLIKAAAEALQVEEKPKYQWVNGARVKIKL